MCRVGESVDVPVSTRQCMVSGLLVKSCSRYFFLRGGDSLSRALNGGWFVSGADDGRHAAERALGQCGWWCTAEGSHSNKVRSADRWFGRRTTKAGGCPMYIGPAFVSPPSCHGTKSENKGSLTLIPLLCSPTPTPAPHQERSAPRTRPLTHR